MLALVRVINRFSSGLQGYARIMKDENMLDAIRIIEGNSNDFDLRLYRVEEECLPCHWSDCFITETQFEVRNGKPVGYQFLASLTPQK